MATVIIGAGIGGLSAAIALASGGEAVTVLERMNAPGGKLVPIVLEGERFDAGPTVLTMRWVFEKLFAMAGIDLATALQLEQLEVLASHRWSGDARLDLYAEQSRSTDAIGRFAGAAAAKSFTAFSADAKRIYETLAPHFMTVQRPTPWSLTLAAGLGPIMRINPYEKLWAALGRYFSDARLRQLFARYATYCGSSPFDAPATLMLVAHVEAQGVWRVAGGMAGLATALEAAARKLGVEFHYGAEARKAEVVSGRIAAVIDAQGTRHACQNAIVAADSNAVAQGLFGDEVVSVVPKLPLADRSLSAVAWCLKAGTSFPLEHHNVFFSDDYTAEFADLGRGAPRDPTVYLCHQGESRMFILVNAKATGTAPESDTERAMLARLAKSGLSLAWPPKLCMMRTPRDFAELYPATGGALYGRASNGWQATFQRPKAQTPVPGLYLAGGSVHPGPGVPMAALSGMLAAEQLLSDRASTRRWRGTGIAGGTSTA
jgi:1-hydroxycarotenoid 3,4-desaturase